MKAMMAKMELEKERAEMKAMMAKIELEKAKDAHKIAGLQGQVDHYHAEEVKQQEAESSAQADSMVEALGDAESKASVPQTAKDSKATDAKKD